MNAEILKYILFASSILSCLIAFTFSDKLLKKSFFNKNVLASIISTFVGIILEATNFFSLEVGIALVIMSVPAIFLLYFWILLWAFRKLKGFDPYISASLGEIGSPTIYWSKGKPKTGRKIISADFAFNFLHALLPAFTILLLIAYLAGRL